MSITLGPLASLRSQELQVFRDIVFEKGTLSHNAAHWEWEYGQNPVRGKELPVLICGSEKKILGSFGTIPATMKLSNGSTITVSFAVDFMVLPEYRNRGIGSFLIKEWLQRSACAGVIEPGLNSYPVFKKMGLLEPCQITYYRKMLSPYQIFLTKTHTPIIANILTSIYRCVDLIWDQALRIVVLLSCFLLKGPAISVTQAQRFNENTDHIWHKFKDTYGTLIHRDKAFTSWRFAENCGRDYTYFFLKQGDTLQAYAVMRIKVENGQKKAMIVDLFGNKQLLPRLLDPIITWCRTQSADMIIMMCGDHDLQRILRSRLFLKNDHAHLLFSVKDTMLRDLLAKETNYHFTTADSDLDFIGD